MPTDRRNTPTLHRGGSSSRSARSAASSNRHRQPELVEDQETLLRTRCKRFIAWLDTALRYRNIEDDATLANMCGISKGTITHWRKLENVPSFDVCKALSRALNTPLLGVLVEAGHLGPGDFLTIEDPIAGGQRLIAQTDGSLGALPVPASDAYDQAAAVDRAKLAIQMVPHLSEDAKWQMIGVLEALSSAAQIQRSQQLRP